MYDLGFNGISYKGVCMDNAKKSTFKFHGFHKALLSVPLLFIVLLASLFCILTVNAADPVYVSDETTLRNAINDAVGPTVIALTANIHLTNSTFIPLDKVITLTNDAGGPWKLFGPNNLDTIHVFGTLTLDGIIVTHTVGTNGRGVMNAGKLFLVDGEISGNILTANEGGGVFIVNDAIFTMQGGVISNNHSPIEGGGVNNEGTFIMQGGVISNNTAGNHGGGVRNFYREFNMSGGAIFNNTAINGNGGGVYSVGNTHRFNLSGGLISNNTARNGGGVYISNGNMIASNSTIFGNTARGTGYGLGGGVYNGGGNFTLSTGAVFNNTATNNGGGVYNTGNFTLSAGTVSNNTATNGGGIYSTNLGSRFNLSGVGAVLDNIALCDGGGVYLPDFLAGFIH